MKVVVSKHVVFEKEKSWDWGPNYKNQIEVELIWGDGISSSDESKGEHIGEVDGDGLVEDIKFNSSGKNVRNIVKGSGAKNEVGSSQENLIQGREINMLVWMEDFVSGEGLSEEEEEDAYIVQDVINNDLSLFKEAMKHEKWRMAMYSEINLIEKNQTWELMDLPIGAKITRLNVKIEFLHEELSEDVYIQKPKGYVKKEKEHKVYKLYKALYNLRQISRVWLNHIESHFVKEGFKKCANEQTLLIGKGTRDNILIVSIYVDNLIYIGDNKEMMIEFKKS
ncbi:hypothetical protein CR513_60353, partial [Mucuna pruriens]